MAVSVFDLFKIGIGPSSSHTVGPMRAARMFTLRLEHAGLLNSVARVKSELFGSLGATGKGHGSDIAVLLGLAGHEPDTVPPDDIRQLVASIRGSRRINLLGRHEIAIEEKSDLVFYLLKALPFHPNGMTFTAYDNSGGVLDAHTYYSVGGGFVVSEQIADDGTWQKVIAPDASVLPMPFRTGDELLARTKSECWSIAEVMRLNERYWRTDEEIDSGLLRIWEVMQACVQRGCKSEGKLPGPLGGAAACSKSSPQAAGGSRGRRSRSSASARLGQPLCAGRQ